MSVKTKLSMVILVYFILICYDNAMNWVTVILIIKLLNCNDQGVGYSGRAPADHPKIR